MSSFFANSAPPTERVVQPRWMRETDLGGLPQEKPDVCDGLFETAALNEIVREGNA